MGFPGGPTVKNPPAKARDAGDAGSIFESGRSPRGENGNPLQYSCLENPMERRAWRAAVHGVEKSWTWLSNWAHIHQTVTNPVNAAIVNEAGMVSVFMDLTFYWGDRYDNYR